MDIKEIEVISLNNRGDQARKNGLYQVAEDYFKKALGIVSQYSISSINQAALYSNYGLLLGNLKKYEEALEYQKKALKLDKEGDDFDNIAFSYHNLGVAYLNLDKFKKAIENLLKAKAIREKINNFDELIHTYEMLSIAYTSNNELDKAEESANAGIALGDKIKNKFSLRGVYSALADIFAKQEKWDSACKTQIIATNFLEELRDNYNDLLKLDKFDSRHNIHYRSAIEYCLMAKNYRDSLDLIDRTRFRSGCDLLEAKQKYISTSTINFPKIISNDIILIEWIYIDHDWSFCITESNKNNIIPQKISTSKHKGPPIVLDYRIRSDWIKHFNRRIKQTQCVLDAYKDIINNYNRIIFIPHGTQWQTPFAALRNPVSKEFLCKTHEFLISPSLRYCRITDKREVLKNKEFLVIGDPTNDLDWARDEANSIANILNTEPIIGSEAKKSYILSRIKNNNFDVIHYAGHSKLYARGLPGLILNDGILTPEDLRNNSFSANLINLSSCWGGIVEDDIWNELRGFVRELLTMNVDNVISSSYPCGDKPLNKFNKIFYDFYKNESKGPIFSYKEAINSLTNEYELNEWGGLYIAGKR